MEQKWCDENVMMTMMLLRCWWLMNEQGRQERAKHNKYIDREQKRHIFQLLVERQLHPEILKYHEQWD